MIVVFGSLGLDLVTAVDRIPKPGETVLGPGYVTVPGGKGANQAVGAARAGSDVLFVGSRGSDAFGTDAVVLMAEAGIDLTHLAVVEDRTALAFITVDARGENAIVVAAGANLHTEARQLEGLDLPKDTVVLLQREIRDEAVHAAVVLAQQRGWRAMLNAAPAGAVPEVTLRALDTLIVNEHEVLLVAEGAGLSFTDAQAAGQALHEGFGCRVVVTLGAEGAVGFSDGRSHAAPSFPVTPVDTTAAGDSFAGAFAAAIDAGLSFPDALRRGTVAGSLACTKIGAQSSIPDAGAIERALASVIR